MKIKEWKSLQGIATVDPQVKRLIEEKSPPARVKDVEERFE
ncbi:hypothetical protein ACFL0O_06070 [Thermodesulfobacteriota bacterium]